MGLWKRYQESRLLRDAIERVETLEGTVKAMRLEWENTYEQMRRMLAKQNARARREASAVETEEAELEGARPAPALDANTPRGSMQWSESQRRLQQEILRKRAGM